MADVILFKGVVLFSSGTTGIGWSFRPGVFAQEVAEAAPPVGIGYWVKEANYRTAEHSLELAWRTTNPAGVRLDVQALATASLGALVLPIWGTLWNCRLSDPGPPEVSRSDGAFYLVRMTLSFVQYP